MLAHATPLRISRRCEHSMAMPVTRRWTAADVRELIQEDRPWPRYELLDGELLVTPAPRGPHQTAASEIRQLLNEYAYRTRIGIAFQSPADLELRSGTIVQPDVFVVPRGSVHVRGREHEWSDITELMLAVEILSPSSLRTDRVLKRDFYLSNNVEEYWIVDCDARVVERWRQAQETPQLIRETLTWSPRSGEPLLIDLPALFTRIDAFWQELRASGFGRETGT